MNTEVPARNIAVVLLHGGCNMRCRFCITENSLECLSYPQALELLAALAGKGFDTVVLGGGEPFTWPHDVLRLADNAKRRGFVVQIGTNGIAMPPDYAERASVDRYVLPLDGSCAETHNRLRLWKKNHYALIHGRLERLCAAGREVTVSTVVNAQNLLGLPMLAAWLDGYVARGGRLHAWHLYKFIPAGRGGARNERELALSARAYNDACARVRTDARPYTIYKRPDMQHSATVDFFWMEKGRLHTGSEVWGEKQKPQSSSDLRRTNRSSAAP